MRLISFCPEFDMAVDLHEMLAPQRMLLAKGVSVGCNQDQGGGLYQWVDF
jgi:hypothetical protein